MTKRLTFNKITRCILFLLALLPIFALVAVFLKVHFIDTQNITATSLGKEFDNALYYVLSLLYPSINSLPWFINLKTILTNAGFLGQTMNSNLIYFVYCYFNYLFEIMFLDLVFQCFTFFISLIRHAVEKLGGDF